MSKNVEVSIKVYVYLSAKVIWLNVITVSILQDIPTVYFSIVQIRSKF